MFANFKKQQERLDIEEKYTSLQEEAQGKTKKLKKVWTMLMAAKSEVQFHVLSNSTVITVSYTTELFTEERLLCFRWLICSKSITERSKVCWKTSGS